jgi:hypothetical protein
MPGFNGTIPTMSIERKRRKWQDIGIDIKDTNDITVASCESLVDLNACVERSQQYVISSGDLLDPTSLKVKDWWDKWLWESDPTEATTVYAPFNRCQLLGLLICRSLPMLGVHCNTPLSDVLPDTAKRLCVVDTPVSTLNIKEMRDTIDNMR